MKISKDTNLESLIGHQAKVVSVGGDHRFNVGEIVTLEGISDIRRNKAWFTCTGPSGKWNVPSSDLEILPANKAELEADLVELEKSIKDIKDRINYLEETKADTFSELGFKVFNFWKMVDIDRPGAKEMLVDFLKQ